MRHPLSQTVIISLRSIMKLPKPSGSSFRSRSKRRVPILIASIGAIVACGTKAQLADTSAKTDRRPAPPANRVSADSESGHRSDSVLGRDPGAAVPQALRWARADSSIVRLPPSSFPALPSVVRADLERRGCSVPQSPDIKEPHSVLSGAFIQAGQTDWAVLCSIDLVSRILVYRGGRTDVVDSLAQLDDRNYLQGNGGDTIVFSREIQLADSAYIASHAEAYDGFKPSPLDHMGIDDVFMDKGSSILYFFKGKWLKLAGAD